MLKHALRPLIAVSFLMVGCSQAPEETPIDEANPQTPVIAEALPEEVIDHSKDYHSYANPEVVQVTHLDLDLKVDFTQRTLSGHVDLTLARKEPGIQTLMLDTRDISIDSVSAGPLALDYRLNAPDPALGSGLEIDLPRGVEKVRIAYQTAPQASGVQWLTPAQTAGKKHPFLFTQAQAIHARSFIPLQDSPKVRVTYTATIRTPRELLAVMSASNDPDTERDGVYEFNMPQAVPSYLIALAVGDLQFKAMGARTGVYAEPSWLDAAAKEFEDTEAMLIETEKHYGPYSWDRYDLLILPPSFPFGGMENPRLSFITPTVIAGDKSLVSLIAHELAHSWSGNTITNATWRDLWLNEGFTTYLTYRIMEFIYGTDRFNMESVLGLQDLDAEIQNRAAEDQILAIDLRGRDPDDVFSNIPYEKGALFLKEMEQKVGRDAFDAFLMNYFKDFAFQSITTEQFMTYLDETLLKAHPDALSKARINQWVFESGIPEGAPGAESDAFSRVDNALHNWLNGEKTAADLNTQDWNFHQWHYFLRSMPEALTQAQMANLDKAFGFTQSGNNEIASTWLLMAINNNYQPAFPRLREFLIGIGRNKLVRPLYRALSKTPEGKAFAKEAFDVARPGYHPLTVKANQGYVL